MKEIKETEVKDEVIETIKEESEITKLLLTKIEEIEKKVDEIYNLLFKKKRWSPSVRQIQYIEKLTKIKGISEEVLKRKIKELCYVDRIQDIKSNEDFTKLIRELKKGGDKK